MIPDWKTKIEREYVRALRGRGSVTPREVAARLGISEDSAVFWLTELARDGQVRITGIEPANTSDENESSPEHSP